MLSFVENHFRQRVSQQPQQLKEKPILVDVIKSLGEDIEVHCGVKVRIVV